MITQSTCLNVAAAGDYPVRRILVSGLREFLAELNVKVHVTQLAKWKTTLQMIALGILLAGPAGDKLVPGVTMSGLTLFVGGGPADAMDWLRLSEGGRPHRHGALKRGSRQGVGWVERSEDPTC